jgi:hypothetical protein
MANEKPKNKKTKKKPGGTYKKKNGKKGARYRVKYPGLDTNYALKIRRDAIDYDYIDQLNDKEKEFLNNFTEEFIGGSFKKNKKQVHPDDLKRDCYGRNNARNRCVYSRAYARDDVKDVTPNDTSESEFIKMAGMYEDFLIAKIDMSNGNTDEESED